MSNTWCLYYLSFCKQYISTFTLYLKGIWDLSQCFSSFCSICTRGQIETGHIFLFYLYLWSDRDRAYLFVLFVLVARQRQGASFCSICTCGQIETGCIFLFYLYLWSDRNRGHLFVLFVLVVRESSLGQIEADLFLFCLFYLFLWSCRKLSGISFPFSFQLTLRQTF